VSKSVFVSNVQWFMFDLSNYQFITTSVIPGDISDSKSIFLTEVPIPGLNYAPIQPAGNGNRKISFTLPLIKRDDVLGNSLLLKQFDVLRNQATGLSSIFSGQFNPNPKVLFSWGTGSVPLVYSVSKCDFSHKKGWINRLGIPQYSEVNMELILDEKSAVYKAEEVYRKASIIAATALAAAGGIGGKY
jgi:hypothetical protein